MRVVGYIRVSSDEQAKKGVSLEAQRARLGAYARTQTKVELVDLIEDAGVSAKSLERPGLNRALAMLEAGEADGLVVVKLDRLTRSVANLQDLVARYFGEARPYELMSLSEAVDTRKAGGRMLLNLMVSIAQWEREIIVERTGEALEHKRSKGENWGTVPYGMRLDADHPARSKKGNRPIVLAVDPVESRAIARIQELRKAHQSLRAIAQALTAEGYPTREGRPWAHRTIDGILKRLARDAHQTLGNGPHAGGSTEADS